MGLPNNFVVDAQVSTDIIVPWAGTEVSLVGMRGSVLSILTIKAASWNFFAFSELVLMCSGIATSSKSMCTPALTTSSFDCLLFVPTSASVSSITRWFSCFHPSEVSKGSITELVMVGLPFSHSEWKNVWHVVHWHSKSLPLPKN